MSSMVLKQSKVVFDKQAHTYHLNGQELQGITSTLIPAIFGDYTADIPEDVLQRAAERGTYLHNEIALIDDGKSFGTDYETMEYERLRNENGLTPVASEYIVTDGKHFASPIDKVYEGDIIADIKTSAKLHYEQVCFQLSWYATHYQKMNKRAVKKAYVVWLPKMQYGKCEISEVKLVPAKVINAIMADYLEGKDVASYADAFKPQLPAKYTTLIAKIKAKKAQLDKAKAEYEQMETTLTDAFKLMGVKSFENDLIRITRIDGTQRTTLDSKAVKDKYPDVFEECKKVTTTKESIRITIKE